MLALKSGVSAEGVAAYKAMSDENRRVSEILVREFGDLVGTSIVDVGCGLGDIAARAWPDGDVLLLDILPYPENQDAPRHVRIEADFFDEGWSRGRTFSTALLAHVLQYVDESPAALYRRLEQLEPKSIITVTDVYDRQFSEIVQWAVDELGSVNPEGPEYRFPHFKLCRERQFDGNLAADSYSKLAVLLAEVVLDRRLLPTEKEAFAAFLASRLNTPSIRLRQAVRGYCHVG